MLLLNPKIEIGLNVGLRSNSIETLPPPPNSQKKFYSLRLCYHNYAIRQKSQNRIAWLQAAVAALVVARHIIFSVATLKKIENPRRATEKAPGQICTDFAENSKFSLKNRTFSEKKWL